MKGGIHREPFVGLFESLTRTLAPIIVIMLTDIISVLQGASLHTIVKYARDCTNHTCHPHPLSHCEILFFIAPKINGWQMQNYSSDVKQEGADKQYQKPLNNQDHVLKWRVMKGEKKKIISGYYFLNKLDCLLRHLFQMTRNMKMCRGDRESGVRMCLQAIRSHFFS